MNIIKRSIIAFFIILLCFGITLLVLTVMCKSELDWFENVFHDKVYVYQLAGLYLIGATYIDQYIKIPALVRMGSRKRATLFSLGLKCGFAFVYLCMVFSLICVIASLNYANIHEKTVVDIFNIFLRYFLGLVLLSVVAETVKKSGNKYLANNAYLCVYLTLVLEVIVIVPEIWKNTSFEPYFIFSWIFYEGILGYVALVMIIVFFLLYLFRCSIRKDIL